MSIAMIRAIALCIAVVSSHTVYAADRVCAPSSMVKIVTSLDVPGAPLDHFVRAPKTLYRSGERFGRTEESLNPQTGLHLLIVVAEPDIWIADLASQRGSYQKDTGPTYIFRAVIFGDPGIQSPFIKSLEFGCEVSWLSKAGATQTNVRHPEFGLVERLEYREGAETLLLFSRSGVPLRLEVRKAGQLYVALRYLEYRANMSMQPALFQRPAGIQFVNAGQK